MERLIGSFYSDVEKKKVRADLFDDTAKLIAGTLSESIADPTGERRPQKAGVSSTQLRRLFDEVKSFERTLKTDNTQSWEKEYPYILMIKSKVAYTVARAVKKSDRCEKYYHALQNFVNEGIGQIKEERDYHIFVTLFEAVYGFYYENAPKD